MKLLFLLFLITILALVVYFFSSTFFRHSKKRKHFNWKPLGISSGVMFVLLGLIALGMYKSATEPDIQCTSLHTVRSKPPTSLKTAIDYFEQGNYDYDSGKCQQAIAHYTKATALNRNYYQAYNNRAYTNMRMRNYKDALADLDTAIKLNPNYIQALMNRGDIHNYYYQIDRQAAIADYKRVIALTGSSGSNTSVCGHLFLAKHDGWHMDTFLAMLHGNQYLCKP